MATVDLSGRGLGRLSTNHVPELYFGLESVVVVFTLLTVVDLTILSLTRSVISTLLLIPVLLIDD